MHTHVKLLPFVLDGAGAMEAEGGSAEAGKEGSGVGSSAPANSVQLARVICNELQLILQHCREN